MGNNFEIICTGSTGLVASDFKKHCQKNSIPFHGVDLRGVKESIDITDYDQLFAYIKNIKTQCHSNSSADGEKSLPKLILFHFAAITITGKNLTQEQIKLSKDVNIGGTENILEVCKKLDIPLVHISTDFVFSGTDKSSPYLPSDTTQADDTIYSQSKLESENLVLKASQNQFISVIRIAFPYGNFNHPKKGLARKMMDWMDNMDPVNLYANQKACPTPISHISKSCLKIAQLISEKQIKSGQIFHTAGKATSPFEFGTMIKNIFTKQAKLNPTKPEDINTNMALDTTDSDQILGFSAPAHEQELQNLRS